MMALMERWGKYWVIYYGIFLAILAFLLARYWSALHWSDASWLPLMAAIFGVAAGIALTFTICAEIGGRMVLLIPAAVRKLRDAGKAEGIQEGIQQGIQEGIQQGIQQGIQEGVQQGIQEGAQQANQRWRDYLERKAAAERAGLPFDEPPPG